MKCEKTCEFNAIHVKDFHASVDPAACTGCGKCAESLPAPCDRFALRVTHSAEIPKSRAFPARLSFPFKLKQDVPCGRVLPQSGRGSGRKAIREVVSMKTEKRQPKPVGFAVSLLVFLALLALVVSFTVGLGSSPHVPLLLTAVLAALVGAVHRCTWREMLEGITNAVTAAVPALLIILSIAFSLPRGWRAGVIPTMVYYGLQIISPSFFLVTALLLCSLVSLAIGSSLSTIGTVGVALLGVGSAIGVPPAITVGAIVSGAYFGDKMSPLSDTTNLAPSVSGAGLFDHVRHMMVTTTPTYLICLVVYGILGAVYAQNGAVDEAQIRLTLDTLAGTL